ncbi:MAG: GAF domain-containing protein [Cyclobacteriaceae bacterium]|nr:GAF domain-containing protein [Cyclobacteriaceae bacterium]
MIDLIKDRYRLGQLLAIFFLVGVAASIYKVYSLPATLSLAYGYQPAFFSVYVVLVITFLLGGLTIYFILQNRREIVVYRDKETDRNSGTKENLNTNQTTITLEGVKESIRKASTEKEIMQAGLQSICKQLEAGQGAIYLATEVDGQRKVELKSGFALNVAESTVISYEFGEGLVGQSAAAGKTLYIDDVPEGYIKIISGLGSASPRYLLIVPLKKQETVVGIMEIASFTAISDDQRKFVEESAQLITDKIALK